MTAAPTGAITPAPEACTDAGGPDATTAPWRPAPIPALGVPVAKTGRAAAGTTSPGSDGAGVGSAAPPGTTPAGSAGSAGTAGGATGPGTAASQLHCQSSSTPARGEAPGAERPQALVHVQCHTKTGADASCAGAAGEVDCAFGAAVVAAAGDALGACSTRPAAPGLSTRTDTLTLTPSEAWRTGPSSPSLPTRTLTLTLTGLLGADAGVSWATGGADAGSCGGAAASAGAVGSAVTVVAGGCGAGAGAAAGCCGAGAGSGAAAAVAAAIACVAMSWADTGACGRSSARAAGVPASSSPARAAASKARMLMTPRITRQVPRGGAGDPCNHP